MDVYPSVIISGPTDLLPAHVGLKVPLSMEGYHNGEKMEPLEIGSVNMDGG
jgi:hypothetical protein